MPDVYFFNIFQMSFGRRCYHFWFVYVAECSFFHQNEHWILVYNNTFVTHIELVCFIKTEEVLSPSGRRRRRRRCQHRRLRPVKFWGKLLRQKIMSSFISSLTKNLFIFAVLIHMVVLIDNQALMNFHLYYFSYFFHVFGNVST